MELKDKIALISDVVQNNTRHPYYTRVTELADDYRAYITADGLDEKLRSFRLRESEDMFAQRKRITKQIVTSISANLKSPAFKVPRSSGINRTLSHKDESKLKIFEAIMSKFAGNHDLEHYMSNRIIDLNYIDPNAYIVVENTGTDGTTYTQPYPFEVSSKEAIYYEKENEVLQLLIVMNTKEIQIGEGSPVKVILPGGVEKIVYPDYKTKTQETYTYYDKEQAIKFVQVYPDVDMQLTYDYQSASIDSVDFIRLNDKIFRIEMPEPYNVSEVPAYSVGYIQDNLTLGKTFVNPFNECVPLMEKLVNVNSELDISMVLHAFPQKVSYQPKCQHSECNGGFLPDNSKCGVCKGTGLQPIATTGQDAIILPLPKFKEEMMDLQTLITYIANTPIDIIKFQNEYIQQVTEHIKQVAFNSDIFTKQEISETATGKNISMQSVYDMLYPFAQNWCDLWENINMMSAELTQLNDGMIINWTISKDFKLMSKEDLINMLKTLKDSGASPAIMKSVEMDLMKSITGDNIQDWNKFVVKDSFAPFADKSADEIRFIIAKLPANNYDVVLWMFFNKIWSELEVEQPNIYTFNPVKIQELISEKVTALKALITPTAPALNIGE